MDLIGRQPEVRTEMSSADTINRWAAIDAIDKCSVWVMYTQGDSQKDEAEFVESIIKQTKKAIQSMLIEDLPSAQQWIPCSETVIEPDHEVLCCDEDGEELIGWLSYYQERWLCESDAEVMYDPVAWMEKPKSWKGK